MPKRFSDGKHRNVSSGTLPGTKRGALFWHPLQWEATGLWRTLVDDGQEGREVVAAVVVLVVLVLLVFCVNMKPHSGLHAAPPRHPVLIPRDTETKNVFLS